MSWRSGIFGNRKSFSKLIFGGTKYIRSFASSKPSFQSNYHSSFNRRKQFIFGISASLASIIGFSVFLHEYEENNSTIYCPGDNDRNFYKSLPLQSFSRIGRLSKFAASDVMQKLGFSKEKMSFKDSQEFFKLYEVGPVIGEGTFACVRVAREKKSGLEVAVKEVCKELSDQQALENEVSVLMATGKHENIISLIDVFDSDKVLYIVTDLANGGELFDKIIDEGELSEQAASKMMKEAVLAAKHLHERNIIHLDIKPENLLLTLSNHIKLADFGLAIKLPGEDFHYVRTECVGTPAYWAPELVKNEAFGKAVDVWALGCVLYILLCGSHPFDPFGDASESEMLAKVVRGDYDKDSAQFCQISPQAKDLLSHMLDPEQDRRYNVKQVLRHPWLSDAEQILSSKPLPLNHITKLKAFRALQLMRMGLSVEAGQTGDDVDGCVRMFSSFDRNKDGVLSRSELASALKKIGVSFNTKEMDELVALFDADEEGMISKESFQKALLKGETGFDFATLKKTLPKRARNKLQHIKYLFDTLDKNNDGYIEREDCVHLMDSLGCVDNKSKLFRRLKRFQTVSQKHSDRIDFAEFVKFFRQMESSKKKQMTQKRRFTARRRNTFVATN